MIIALIFVILGCIYDKRFVMALVNPPLNFIFIKNGNTFFESL